MHVRHLEVSFADVPTLSQRLYRYDEQGAKISEDIRIQAVEAASLYGLDESVREQLAEGWLGAALFLLLCHFPNLNSLDLVPGCRTNFFPLIAGSRMLPCGLRSLRSVYINEENWGDISYEDIFAFFNLPSLRIIRCQISYPSDYEHDAATPKYQMVLFGGTSQIEVIDITSIHVDTWVLAAMVRSVQHLRSFCYKERSLALQSFLGALLGGALEVHAHTLEIFKIEVINIDYDRLTPIGSLRQYTKLTRLAISLPILIGNPHPITELRHPPRRIGDLLPESLISFDVCIDNKWQHTAREHLTQFVEVDLKHVPNLTQLSLTVHGFLAWDWDSTALEAACVASGITFSLHHYRSASTT